VTCALDYESGIRRVPSDLVNDDGDRRWVTGLTEAMVQAYANGVLLRDLGGWRADAER
jgi:hypothetical protein